MIQMGLVVLGQCFFGTAYSVSDASALLVESRTPRAVLVLPAQAHEDEELAAKELQIHIAKMSGARLTIVRGDVPKGLLPVRIGLSLSAEAKARILQQSDDPGAFLIDARADRISLAGNAPEGTLIAAYELLEQLGCRWYLPGELGAVIPKRVTVTMPLGQTLQVPSFPHRHLQCISLDLPWYRRQRLGGLYFPGAHGISLRPKANLKTEPELFALVNGERKDTQLCLSNPEVLKRAIAAAMDYFDRHPDAQWLGMGPRDNGVFCECERCQKLDSGDVDPVTNRRIRTDRYVWFFNQIIEAVHKKYPGKKIAFYGYDALKFPPRKVKPSPYLVPAFAPITQCRIHGINNPICPDRSFYKKTMVEWTRVVPETFERGYYFNLACPGFPFSKIHAVREETPFAHKLGVKGWRVESKPSWASNGLTLYVAARLMWDVNTDVDALMIELCEKFFGPAAKPMGDYLEMVDHAFRDTDCHTGSSFCMPKVFTPARMARGRTLLDRAARLAGGPEAKTYAERGRIFRLNHDRLEAFLNMLEQRNRFDFASANASLDRLYEISDVMVNYRLHPPGAAKQKPSDMPYKVWFAQAWLLYPGVVPSYINRFWAPCTRSGYERTVAKGDLVAGLPDVWDFLIDPTGVGEGLRWYRDGRIGGNWQPLRTKSSTWSDQGLHYYKGLAWHRTVVTIPNTFQRRKVFLWFGGMDEAAKVWLNGELLGQSDAEGGRLVKPAGAFKPFEFDVNGIVRIGRPNTVAVKIINHRLSEIGTGGITAPVMFWSPKPK